ncbi:twin-arginine translocase TatA/TatE family subunit [Streptomyces sp. PSKA28]|uniref:Twin-arginine translocase TatA/TatE family subunit n=1 Tax=Streptomyces himalayensis subsp. himalayensis TaxID=2756131 RepID=A0A7W0DU19_9ACTN|nr:twin-arginine translocase TatA/TatE family subunit [Streptomyces himalayensis subsp. himalayensis]
MILLALAAVLAVKRLTDLTRSAGKTAHIFKSESKALKQDEPGQGSASQPGTRIVSGQIVEDGERPSRL